MYVGDLAKILGKLVITDITPGIYNISSSRAISLLELTNKIIEIVKPIESNINFGAIPYRANQSMHIQGSNLKLETEIGEKIEEIDFIDALNKVIKYKLNKH
jgi:dTDP-4-dehydrorhamnose reductase